VLNSGGHHSGTLELESDSGRCRFVVTLLVQP